MSSGDMKGQNLRPSSEATSEDRDSHFLVFAPGPRFLGSPSLTLIPCTRPWVEQEDIPMQATCLSVRLPYT